MAMRDPSALRVGATVISADGHVLGRIRERFPHFILVGQEGAPHADLSIPIHAIERREGDRVYVTVNRDAVTAVDDEEASRRRLRLGREG